MGRISVAKKSDRVESKKYQANPQYVPPDIP